MIRALGVIALLALPLYSAAETSPPPPELVLVSEHPVEGIPGGNLSGLAWCGDGLQAVSDRDDHHLYRLDMREAVWQAEAERLEPPPVPDSGLPWGLRMRTLAISPLRGGSLDFEGLSCDALGNRYLLSEGHAAVLRVSATGDAQWLDLPRSLLRQARASGMMLKYNALYEGIAVDPKGERLWLAAERERRGLLVVHRNGARWRCTGGCVLLSEGGMVHSPVREEERWVSKDFTALAWFDNKLFTLERAAHQLCRRNPANGEVERCWSFAATAGEADRRYAQGDGHAEALWVDADGVWVGLDNNFLPRGDGDARPIIWRFAAPRGGWGARR
ncbi:esterase-like activity of phytase family protein [Stutzerimonas tarimensis]|uniref:Esterase-like activity of phytase family protein n=1 Tax=Stutzerimonas tarimensis TaxID=1507735 RepID=A0ABV7T3K2_9GAMM